MTDNVIEFKSIEELKEDIKSLVKLDPQTFEVTVNISPTENKDVFAYASLKRPTLEDDFKFAKFSGAEFRDVSSQEEQILLGNIQASVKLFDKIVTDVKGYKLDGEAKEEGAKWRDAEAMLSLIPTSHKVAFIRGMRNSTARYIANDDDCYTLGGNSTLSVDLIIGNEDAPAGIVHFEVPEPTEEEKQDFESRAMQYLQGKGSKRRSTRSYTDMQVCAEFFNMLMVRSGAQIKNGRVGEQIFEKCESQASKTAFIVAIDPTFKMKVIGAALVKYSARLQD